MTAPKKLKIDSKAAGDLRLIPAHIEHYKKGVPEAARALRDLGRDAAELVIEIAKQKGDAELEAFGKKLIALKPQYETNMIELRAESIDEVLERGAKAAMDAAGAVLDVDLPAFGLFDPLSVADALVKGGRPRADNKRVARGDLAWFPIGGSRRVRIAVGPAPEASTHELRLKVTSNGLVYAGPPEASDGPRLGSVRLHPHRTQLDAYEDKGRFLRVPEGYYAVHVDLPDSGEVTVTLALTDDPAPIEVDLGSLGVPLPPAPDA
ncbi:MAG: hypothetical protein U1E65_26775 [Myxococcota bacterium]